MRTRRVGVLLLVGLLLLASGCTQFNPRPLQEVGFERRALSKTEGSVQVSVVALTEQETHSAMGVELAHHGIQPVWVKVENHESIGFVIPPMAIDHDYFSATEAAWQVHGLNGATNARMEDYFRNLSLPIRVGPGETVSGFVFTNLDKGTKYVAIELLANGATEVRRFTFLARIPDLKADYLQPQNRKAYEEQEIKNLDEAAFRTWVERLPCCVLGGDRKTPGDPLNVVFVGENQALFPALARQGWHMTESISSGSVWRTISSSVFGRSYRYGPVSPLYAFGRHQDIAVQKARNDVDLRNHMRLWRAPINLNGTPVWAGQISRDIGVRLSAKTLTTHKVDPDVDGARLYLMQDVFYSQSLREYAFAKGVGAVTPERPRVNYTGDPYWTDGLRLVMWLSVEPISYQKVQSARWQPAPR
ncbi:MAG: LssY C-terminal domain-containing protein [Deltaproteobacteria bacterium]|nr:LssY C-terminal domain-containing protein [Deltaproteobacteria bacterium]